MNNLSNDSFENNKNNNDLILKYVLDKIEKLYENFINDLSMKLLIIQLNLMI